MGCCFSRVKCKTEPQGSDETLLRLKDVKDVKDVKDEFIILYDRIKTMTLPEDKLFAYDLMIKPFDKSNLPIAFGATDADDDFLKMKNDSRVLRIISSTFRWAVDHEDSILVVKSLDVGTLMNVTFVLTSLERSICQKALIDNFKVVEFVNISSILQRYNI